MSSSSNYSSIFDLIQESQEGFLFFVPKDGDKKLMILGIQDKDKFNFKTFFHLPKEVHANLLNLIKSRALEEINFKEEENQKVLEIFIESFCKGKKYEAEIFKLQDFKMKVKEQ